MTENNNNNQQNNNEKQLKEPRPDLQKEKTPLQMYNELKIEREKERKEFAQKDKEYQIELIKQGEKLDRVIDELQKAKTAEEVAKTKYWASKESDYREAVDNRQNTGEGMLVQMIYDVLDNQIKETEHLKKNNVWYI